MQAYLETVHFFQTNKAGTARILQKYMRGVSEQDITLWCDELRAILRQVPYPDEDALRAEMEMMGAANQQLPAGYVNNTLLDEIKKSGFIEKLYKQ
jgi:hypothetical protein